MLVSEVDLPVHLAGHRRRRALLDLPEFAAVVHGAAIRERAFFAAACLRERSQRGRVCG